MDSNTLQWDRFEIGGGVVEGEPPDLVRLTVPPRSSSYADAQVDDYRNLPRKQFAWNPPLHLTLRARASHAEPIGTLGFGFWNDPFTLSLGQGGAARRFPAAPQALWFFYGSPPNDFSFSKDVPGSGWKAASLTSPRIPSLFLAPIAVGAIALAQIPGIRRPIMRTAQRAVRASERLLDVPLHQWHHYELRWESQRALFLVDGNLELEAFNPPYGPLGFIAWIDNQFLIASPEGGFRFGIIPISEQQWLELSDIRVLPL
jgi:hypothetical protein